MAKTTISKTSTRAKSSQAAKKARPAARPAAAAETAEAAYRDTGDREAGYRESGHRETDAEAARWTFLTNHSHVLIVLSQEPNLVLREVAARVGITERAVQRIISDLEQGGVIEREKVGRTNVYRTLLDRPLRHPIESHRTIRELIEMITGPKLK